MTNIAVTIRDGVATAKLTGILTTGMVGVPVTFDLGPEWEDLSIIAVIRGNGLIFDRPLLGTRQTTVPYEVLEKVGEHISIGAEGCSASGDLVIQSNFAELEETVRQGADPSGDIAIDPTQPIWAELMHEVEDLRENTVDPETLSQHDLDPLAHASIREQLQGKLSISDIADDLYTKSSALALSANMGAYLRERLENGLLDVEKDLEAQVQERVKTVNGIAPDENGNVVVAGGSGGNGEDGYSPVANVTQTDTGAVISITDKNGTTTAAVTNGADGKTPVKGVDYFTEAEKQEIAEQAAELVDVPEGGGSGGSGGWKHIDTVELSADVLSYQFDTAGYSEVRIVNMTALNMAGSGIRWKYANQGIGGGYLALGKVQGTVHTLSYLGNGVIAFSNGRSSDTLLTSGVATGAQEANNALILTFSSVTSGTILIAGRA